MDKLKHIGIVNSVLIELEDALPFGDRDLLKATAEFVVHLAQQHKDSVEAFAQALKDNDAVLSDSVVASVFRIVHGTGKARGGAGGPAADGRRAVGVTSSSAGPAAGPARPADPKTMAFPGLALPNASASDTVDESAAGTATDSAGGGTSAEPSAVMASRRAAEEALASRSDREAGRHGRRDDDATDRSSRRNRSDGDRSRRRDRSRSRSRSRERGRDRGSDRRRRRSPDGDRDRHDSSRRTHKRDRHGRERDSDRSRDRGRDGRSSRSSGPELYGIYEGEVTKVMDFGCFIRLKKFGREGMCHVTDMGKKEGRRLVHPRDGVEKGQRVLVKVISLRGEKMSLSMRDVNQETGEDILPMRGKHLTAPRTNPSRAEADGRAGGAGAGAGGGIGASAEPHRPIRRLSSPERFEAQQLIASGVLPVEEYPTFDEEVGMVHMEEAEEDIEVEIREDEPPFLAGQTRQSRELSPIKVVKNPDGSLQRAAMTQSALSKERRELRETQRRELLDSIPKDLSRPWNDPMPEDGERHLAQELYGLGAVAEEPEWKSATGMTKAVAYGQQSSLPIKEQRESLPIYALRDKFIEAMRTNQVLVVIGETGSGKTTQMTQYLVEAGFCTSGAMVGCTQPRRVAAMSVAKRVAEEMGCRLGDEVGYSIRFEDMTSSDTVIKYMTDGMLMREYLMDNMLRRYRVIMLDEAHERTIHTDVLFGLLKGLLKRRKDLKLIVTSATLDAEKFSRYFMDAPILPIPGRTHPVTILYAKEPETDYVDAALITVMQIHLSEPKGDILVFLTGQEEIDGACEILYERMKSLGKGVPPLLILPVYGALPAEMQSRIFEPAPPLTRKVVLATNIAEASLTIDGIYYVVDPGFCKQKVFNPKVGMDSLVVVPTSQASAKQRAGRAGRTGPGKCYRLYTEAAYNTEMLPNSVPEIQRTNLANVVLQLKAMGINDLLHFDFMDPPPVQVLVSAMEALYALDALDDEGLLTVIGRKMAEFPLEPSLSKILLKSVELGCSEEVLTIVSYLSVENVFYRPKEKQAQADQKKSRFHQPEGDHLTMLAVYEAWKAAKFSNAWCYENFIQARAMRRGQDVRKQLLGICDRYKLDIRTAGRNYTLVRKAITAGFFTNVAKKDPTEGYRTMVEGQPVYIHPSSALFNKNPEWVIYHELVLTTKEYMRNIMEIDPKWLVELAPRFYARADPTRMTKRKRMERIEPLYDRFNPPDSWRLSKRPG